LNGITINIIKRNYCDKNNNNMAFLIDELQPVPIFGAVANNK